MKMWWLYELDDYVYQFLTPEIIITTCHSRSRRCWGHTSECCIFSCRQGTCSGHMVSWRCKRRTPLTHHYFWLWLESPTGTEKAGWLLKTLLATSALPGFLDDSMCCDDIFCRRVGSSFYAKRRTGRRGISYSFLPPWWIRLCRCKTGSQNQWSRLSPCQNILDRFAERSPEPSLL